MCRPLFAAVKSFNQITLYVNGVSEAPSLGDSDALSSTPVSNIYIGGVPPGKTDQQWIQQMYSYIGYAFVSKKPENVSSHNLPSLRSSSFRTSVSTGVVLADVTQETYHGCIGVTSITVDGTVVQPENISPSGDVELQFCTAS